MLPGQQPLTNFYENLQFSNPAMAQRMSNDIRKVVVYSMAPSLAENHELYNTIHRLRRLAMGLSAVQARMLDHALEELGYELDPLYDE